MKRRTFLGTAAAASVAASVGCAPKQDGATKKSAGLKILILGGTSFLGPELVEAAKAKGHAITLFNRGKTRPHLFPELEKLHGDRDPKKDEGLKALEGRTFDLVFDNSGFYPRMVKASAELLAPNVKHYVYVSSISAYGEKMPTPGIDETAPVATLADPTVETMGKQFENYGGLKAACEKAAEAAMPGRVTNVRPGFIVGPNDPTDRFTYWPARFDRGGEVLCPGDGSDPTQFIDVRDLAEWMLRMGESKTPGVYNATGPKNELSTKTFLNACRDAAGKETTMTWVPYPFIEKDPDPIDTTILHGATGDMAGFSRVSSAKAIAAGLTYRPVATTVKDTLAWWRTQPEERRAKPKAGMSAETEAAVLARFKKTQG